VPQRARQPQPVRDTPAYARRRGTPGLHAAPYAASRRHQASGKPARRPLSHAPEPRRGNPLT